MSVRHELVAPRHLVQWCSASPAIVFIRDSRYGMPAVQSVHLVGITMYCWRQCSCWTLRLAGIGMMDWSPLWLERQLKPWAIGCGDAGPALGRFSSFSARRPNTWQQQSVSGQDDRSWSGAPVPLSEWSADLIGSESGSRSRRTARHCRRDLTDAVVPGGLGGTSYARLFHKGWMVGRLEGGSR